MSDEKKGETQEGKGNVVVVEQNDQNQNNHPNLDDNTTPVTNVPSLAINEFGDELKKMIAKAGTLESSKEEKEIVFGAIDPKDVYIKPDGLIYLTWVKYANRLSKAYGTAWAIIPQGMPKVSKDNRFVIWGFHLVIRGVYCGFAIGEQEYHDNRRMTWGEACEGAKSNALTRLCKNFGIGTELWDKAFIDRWVKTYAVKTWDPNADNGRGKNRWSLKPNAFGDEPPITTPVANPVVANPVVANPVVSNTGKTEKTETGKTETPVTTGKVEPVKEETTSTNTTTAKTGNGKPAYTGKGKTKLPENKDFLNDGKKKDEKVPMVPMTEEEVTGQTTATAISNPQKVAELTELIEKSDLTGRLKANYETVKKCQAEGLITEEEKETLRKMANKLFVKLATQGK